MCGTNVHSPTLSRPPSDNADYEFLGCRNILEVQHVKYEPFTFTNEMLRLHTRRELLSTHHLLPFGECFNKPARVETMLDAPEGSETCSSPGPSFSLLWCASTCSPGSVTDICALLTCQVVADRVCACARASSCLLSAAYIIDRIRV